MPSLNDLGQFKFSFNNLAGEKEDSMLQHGAFDDLPLPTKEATPIDFNAPAPGSPAEEAAPAPAGSPEDIAAGAFDFGAFLNDLPDVAPPEDDLLQNAGQPAEEEAAADVPAETPAEEVSVDDASLDSLLAGGDTPSDTETAAAPADEAAIPDDLLSGLQEDIESAPADAAPEEAAAGDFNLDDFDIPQPDDTQTADTAVDDAGLDGLDLDSLGGESSAAAESPADENNDIDGAIDLGGESPHVEGAPAASAEQEEDLDLDLPADDDESAIDLGGESPHVGEETAAAAAGADDFSLDDVLPNTETPADMPDETASDLDADFDSALPSEAAADEDFDSALPDMDFPAGGDETADLPADFGSDGIDLAEEGAGAADLGADFESDSIDLGDGGGEQEGAGDGDFDLPGLDEVLGRGKLDTAPEPEEKKGFFRRRKKPKPVVEDQASDDIEEIRLSQEDLDKLLKTLGSYPLNLRIVCQELIAEQVILPQQLSKLIRLLVNGANVRETADFAKEITGKEIVIPKSFEKMTGAAFEAEQSSFAYIFVHNFLPVFRIFAIIVTFLICAIYLGYRFIYIPVKAENLYKRGYERIFVGEYQRANELFHEAFVTHRKKKWFYSYAEGFRDQRRYMLAEAKYDELLRYYPRDKKGVLDYAALNTYYLFNYDKANTLLQQQLLDYAPNDIDGLLAAGDNFMAWADSDPERFYNRYDDARFSYARVLELYGWKVPVVERMLKYFIHTDNLKEVLYLRVWFENDPKKRPLSAPSLAELGGYLLDKQLEVTQGVPDPYIESIQSVREMLLKAMHMEPTLPEPHYHLARYHHALGNTHEERLTLENAIRAFDLAQTESIRRRLNRVDAHYRYANLLVEAKEFFPAEEQLVKGIELYEDFLTRNLIRATPQLGQLYGAKGDIEFFVKSGDMQAALRDYHTAERYGFSPPEIQYRMGSAYYQLENWRSALDYLFKASTDLPLNRRMLYALGNAAFRRGDFFAAQGYYDRLINVLENQRLGLTTLMPNDGVEFLDLGERLMMARNNAGVVYEALAQQTGNREYRSRAMALYAESSRAWDAVTRNPQTMIRSRFSESSGAPSINLGYLNANNALRPVPNYSPQIFPRIDKDVLEPSKWEALAPFGGLQQ
jgi:tetratricopeptide (TPR) repeat protein